VCAALVSGHIIGMAWGDVLDWGLANTLADQLQVLTRDEQRVQLAYLNHTSNPTRFAERVNQSLGGPRTCPRSGRASSRRPHPDRHARAVVKQCSLYMRRFFSRKSASWYMLFP
jgi:hypothetical protein